VDLRSFLRNGRCESLFVCLTGAQAAADLRSLLRNGPCEKPIVRIYKANAGER